MSWLAASDTVPGHCHVGAKDPDRTDKCMTKVIGYDSGMRSVWRSRCLPSGQE